MITNHKKLCCIAISLLMIGNYVQVSAPEASVIGLVRNEMSLQVMLKQRDIIRDKLVSNESLSTEQTLIFKKYIVYALQNNWSVFPAEIEKAKELDLFPKL